jgi:hypothetical protein
MPQHSTTIAIGPRMPGWGSWEWLGADLAAALRGRLDVRVFEGDFVPECDVAIVVKHPLRLPAIESLAQRCHVVYAPVDHYGSVADVDAAHPMLRRCSRIVVHSEGRIQPVLDTLSSREVDERRLNEHSGVAHED